MATGYDWETLFLAASRKYHLGHPAADCRSLRCVVGEAASLDVAHFESKTTRIYSLSSDLGKRGASTNP